MTVSSNKRLGHWWSGRSCSTSGAWLQPCLVLGRMLWNFDHPCPCTITEEDTINDQMKGYICMIVHLFNDRKEKHLSTMFCPNLSFSSMHALHDKPRDQTAQLQ